MGEMKAYCKKVQELDAGLKALNSEKSSLQIKLDVEALAHYCRAKYACGVVYKGKLDSDGSVMLCIWSNDNDILEKRLYDAADTVHRREDARSLFQNLLSKFGLCMKCSSKDYFCPGDERKYYVELTI